MDAPKGPSPEEEEYRDSRQTTNSSLIPAVESELSTATRPSVESLHSAFESDTDDLLSPDMDGHGDAYRRRKAQLMAEYENGAIEGRQSGKRAPSRPKSRASNDSLRPPPYTSAKGQESDFSSMSTSDDVEMDHLHSEEGLTDDEETGLTKKDKQHRKRRRRKIAGLDARLVGNSQSSGTEQKLADRNVLKAMLINVLLIASWYTFSLSISIVSVLSLAR